MHFSDRIIRSISKKGTPLCVGFDPHLDLLPSDLLNQYKRKFTDPVEMFCHTIEDFLLQILDEIHPLVGIIKPQFAFFERLGPQGMAVLQRICHEAKSRNMIVIGDAKRGDIGSTAQAYADAYFTPTDSEKKNLLDPAIPVDALTINPYLGFDAVKPFLDKSNQTGVFILVKTSNPSGSQIQDLQLADGTIAEYVARSVNQWGENRMGESGFSDVGAVVGATYPQQAVKMRELLPQTLFLIPGYGSQGGGALDAVAGFNSEGQGGIINSSRGILFAYRRKPYCKQYDENDFAKAAAAACRDSIADINSALNL